MREPRVLLLGTGLIGSSIGLALQALRPGFSGRVLGWDANPGELAAALQSGAIEEALPSREAVLTPGVADIYVLATPVLPILDWMGKLAPVLGEDHLVTDVGSTKLLITEHAVKLFNAPGRARFLPGHPMAGKESGGAARAEAGLFRGAAWIFTEERPAGESGGESEQESVGESGQAQAAGGGRRLEARWRGLVEGFGAVTLALPAGRHDELCAWVSHLPQMLSTGLAALLEETFAGDPQGRAALEAMGGRALRETTRLGSSPYSMWRDVALTNTVPLAATLLALEQRLAHLRENLRTPELRAEFERANRFRNSGSRA